MSNDYSPVDRKPGVGNPFNQPRKQVKDRFYVKRSDTNEIIYAHHQSNCTTVKARNQSKKHKDIEFFVYDTLDPPEERVKRGRPEYIHKYINCVYYCK